MAKNWTKVIPMKEGSIQVSQIIVDANNNTWEMAKLEYIPSKEVQDRVVTHPVIEPVGADAVSMYVEAVPEYYLSSLIDDCGSDDKEETLKEILGEKTTDE